MRLQPFHSTIVLIPCNRDAFANVFRPMKLVTEFDSLHEGIPLCNCRLLEPTGIELDIRILFSGSRHAFLASRSFVHFLFLFFFSSPIFYSFPLISPDFIFPDFF